MRKHNFSATKVVARSMLDTSVARVVTFRALKRIASIAVLLVLVSTSISDAATILSNNSTTLLTKPWQQWSDQSQMPTVQGDVYVNELDAQNTKSICKLDQAIACTMFSQNSIGVFNFQINIDTSQPFAELADTERHELGHDFNFAYLTPDDEQKFMNILHLSGSPTSWWKPFSNKNGSPGEWWAEGYRLCADWGIHIARAFIAGIVNTDVAYNYPGLDNLIAQTEICKLIIQIGIRNNLQIPVQKSYFHTHLISTRFVFKFN